MSFSLLSTQRRLTLQINEKTAQLYSLFKVSHYTQNPKKTEELIERIKLGNVIGENLFNSFELIAPDVYPEYVIHRDAFFKNGAENVLLAGSGPSLFSLMRDKKSALMWTPFERAYPAPNINKAP